MTQRARIPVGPAPLGRRAAAVASDVVLLALVLTALGVVAGLDPAAGLVVLAGTGYFGLLEGLARRTVGGALLGIAVLDRDSGRAIGALRGMARASFRALSCVVVVPAVLAVARLARDGRSATPWDRRAGTVVVRLGTVEQASRAVVAAVVADRAPVAAPAPS